jgi:hypothetical protein
LFKLLDLAGVVELETVAGEHATEPGVGHHGGVPDALHGGDGVADRDRIEAVPLVVGRHPGVDLQCRCRCGSPARFM